MRRRRWEKAVLDGLWRRKGGCGGPRQADDTSRGNRHDGGMAGWMGRWKQRKIETKCERVASTANKTAPARGDAVKIVSWCFGCDRGNSKKEGKIRMLVESCQA